MTTVIREVLKDQKERPSPRTYSDYVSVIELFGYCLHNYGWNYLPEEEYKKYNEYER